MMNNSFVKDLSLLGRDIKNMVIVDNSPASYILQPENAIPIKTWIDDTSDDQLFQLLPILEYLAQVPDVRPVIKRLALNDGNAYSQALNTIQTIKVVNKVSSTRNNLKVDTWVEQSHTGIIV